MLCAQYAQPISKKAKAQPPAAEAEEKKKPSNHAQRKLDERKKGSSSQSFSFSRLFTITTPQSSRSILFLSHSSVLVVCTPPSPAGPASPDVPMVTFSRARNWRYVLIVPHGVPLMSPCSSTSEKSGQESRNMLKCSVYFSLRGTCCSGRGYASKLVLISTIMPCYVHCNPMLHISSPICEAARVKFTKRMFT